MMLILSTTFLPALDKTEKQRKTFIVGLIHKVSMMYHCIFFVSITDVPSSPSKPYATETTLFTVILSWSEPDSDGGSLVKTYRVEMCNAEEEEWQTLSENCSVSYF